MPDINDLRSQIDELDNEIVTMFLKRLSLCEDVGKYKLKNGLPILDTRREEELLEAKTKGFSGQDKKDIIKLFTTIMDISKNRQQRLSSGNTTVAYCGTKGAFAYFAAKTISLDEPVQYPSFFDTFNAVEKGEVDLGVLPIENTTSGSVLEIYDLLFKSNNFIVGELTIPVHHCLLSCGDFAGVTTIVSHPQAVSQCSRFLNAHSFKINLEVNTAIAAQKCAKSGDTSVGVIASKECGQLYGLNVLMEDIQDNDNNTTRFIVVSRKSSTAFGANKASLTFTLPHRHGALLEILNRFNGVNLTKIESRPVGDFEYRFYLDFVHDDPASFIDSLTLDFNSIKVLGIYPKADV